MLVGITLSHVTKAKTNVGPEVLQEKEKPPRPPGVSPSRPEIEPPDIDENWYCNQCQSHYPFPKRHYKEKNHRPMLMPQGGKAHEKTGWHKKKRGGIAADRLLRHARTLELTGDQVSRLNELVYQTKKKMIDLRAKLQKERLELKHLMQSGTEDMTRIRRQLNLVAKKRVDLQEARIAHWFDAKKVLSDEQREMIKAEHPRLDRLVQ
jgi:Spy/CpxP family protein refolding chaperone